MEAILNSGPLAPISDDRNNFTALTSAHVLIGDTTATLTENRRVRKACYQSSVLQAAAANNATLLEEVASRVSLWATAMSKMGVPKPGTTDQGCLGLSCREWHSLYAAEDREHNLVVSGKGQNCARGFGENGAKRAKTCSKQGVRFVQLLPELTTSSTIKHFSPPLKVPSARTYYSIMYD